MRGRKFGPDMRSSGAYALLTHSKTWTVNKLLDGVITFVSLRLKAKALRSYFEPDLFDCSPHLSYSISNQSRLLAEATEKFMPAALKLFSIKTSGLSLFFLARNHREPENNFPPHETQQDDPAYACSVAHAWGQPLLSQAWAEDAFISFGRGEKASSAPGTRYSWNASAIGSSPAVWMQGKTTWAAFYGKTDLNKCTLFPVFFCTSRTVCRWRNFGCTRYLRKAKKEFSHFSWIRIGSSRGLQGFFGERGRTFMSRKWEIGTMSSFSFKREKEKGGETQSHFPLFILGGKRETFSSVQWIRRKGSDIPWSFEVFSTLVSFLSKGRRIYMYARMHAKKQG